jgi:hypothetical protein
MFENTLFRCSALHNLMTEPLLKADKEAGLLSKTAKTYLMEVYIKEKYGRENNFSSKYTEKGILVEEDSIELYNLISKKFYLKNERNLKNKYISGTPDLFAGLEIEDAEMIIDIKSSWDIFTFFKVQTEPVNTAYWWQLQGYMALTGAISSRLVYCLVNTPLHLIDDEKRRLLYKMNCVSEESPEYIKACKELDRLMIFDDILAEKRVFEIYINRDEEAIQKIYAKVEKARQYLCELDEKI